MRWLALLCLCCCFWTDAAAVPAEESQESVVRFLQQVDQPFGGSQSPDDARAAAIAKGKAEALEKAGTYLESYTVVEDFVLQTDETLALTAGILQTEVVSQENYATETGFGIRLDIQVDLDKSVLATRLDQIRDDQVLLRRYKELQDREAALLERIKVLEAQTQGSRPEAGGSDASLEDYRSAIQALPAVALNRRALESWRNGQFLDPRKALNLLDEALALDPDNVTTINNRGVALYQMGQMEAAVEAFSRAVALAPAYADAYNNRGIAYMAMQNYQAAENDFTRVLELMPLRVETYIDRGVARKNLWRHHEALEDYQRALLIDPQHAHWQAGQDSASLDYRELERICEKAGRACRLGLCSSLNYLRERELCTSAELSHSHGAASATAGPPTAN